MKVSRFNVFVPEDNNGEHLVYNTLTGSITRVDAQLAYMLERNDLANVEVPGCSELLGDLRGQGVVVDEKFDELAEYEKMHKRWKEGKENVEFNVLLTYDCNFECPYCYQGRGEKGQQIHGYRYMSPELLASVKKFIKRTAQERGAKG